MKIRMSLAIKVVCFAVAAFFFSGSAWAEKKVLIYHSYPPGEWVHGINRSFEETFGKLGVTVTVKSEVFHSEYWLNKKPTEQSTERTRLLKVLNNEKPDLVLLCDDEVTDFIIQDVAAKNTQFL